MQRLRVDDPLDAFSIHGFCGLWGVLASGIFNTTDGLVAGKSEVFGGCCLGAVVIIAWSVLWALVVFLPMK